MDWQSTARQETRQLNSNDLPRQEASTYRIFPRQGSKSPFQSNSPPAGAADRKPVLGPFDSQPSKGASNDVSSKGTKSPERRGAPSQRKKEGVSDIVVDMMTTVTEYAMDSRMRPSTFSFEYH